MVYLWAVVGYGTKSTPFNYGLLDRSNGAHRIVSNIKVDFIKFPTGGNNSETSPETSRQKRKSLPAPSSDNNELHSSRISDGTTTTNGTVGSTARDSMGLPKTVAFANQGRRPRGTPRKKVCWSRAHQGNPPNNSGSRDNSSSSSDNSNIGAKVSIINPTPFLGKLMRNLAK